jgi:hypothetical protein
MSIAELFLTQYTQEQAFDLAKHYEFLKSRSRDELILLGMSIESGIERLEYGCNITNVNETNNIYKNMMKKFTILDTTALVHLLCKRKTFKKESGRIEYGASIFGDCIKMILDNKRAEETRLWLEKRKQMEEQRLVEKEKAKQEAAKENELLNALARMENEKTNKMLEIMAEAAAMEW